MRRCANALCDGLMTGGDCDRCGGDIACCHCANGDVWSRVGPNDWDGPDPCECICHEGE